MSNSKEAVEKTPEARWRHLHENGMKQLVFLDTNEQIEEKPKWFDADRFAQAREVIAKYYIGVRYSSFTGLLLILQLPDGLEPLLSTGNSKDILSLHKRYVNTIVHVDSWYESDVFNPETKGYKSIRQVRAMHRRVQNIMNEKFNVPDQESELGRKWFNDYDVALTQFAFIGLAMLFPQKCGFIMATKEELEMVNYYWRVLGHLMGVKDEFNCCQFEKYDDIRAYHELIFRHEYLDSYDRLKCKTGLGMSQAICLALHDYMPTVTFNGLAHWWKDCFHFNGYELKPLSAKEKVLDMTTSLSFNHLFKYESVARFLAKLQKKRLESKLKNREKIYKKLENQYKNDQEHIFLSDRQEYFAKDSKPKIEADLAAGVCPLGFGRAANQQTININQPEVACASS